MRTTDAKDRVVVALESLLNEMPLDKIAIRTLAEKAGLSRQSFYYHFSNIFEVCQYALRYDIPPNATMFEAVDTISGSLERHPAITLAFMYSEYRDTMREIIHTAIRDGCMDFLVNIFSMNIVSEYIEDLTDFAAEGYIGILGDWIQHGMDYDIHERLEHVHRGLRDVFPRGAKLIYEKEHDAQF